MQPCREADGSPAARPIVWSRRNGPWHRVDVLFVGAAPGNAGGRGSGSRGAHATRIPFGGDVAGANLDVLLGSVGLDRNATFIVAALNQLPAAGGGEPTPGELAAPVGHFPTSVHLLRDTLLATRPRLVVLLGNSAARVTLAAPSARGPGLPKLPAAARLGSLGLTRGALSDWPVQHVPDDAFLRSWRAAMPDAALPALLLCWHPSAQNMSPFAGATTVFAKRMRQTRTALRAAFDRLGLPRDRHPLRSGGVYALPEWQTLIAPYHERLAALWRERGIG